MSFPEAVESSHMDHPDFRVGGRIFATLLPDPLWGCVMLTPEQQEAILRQAPMEFVPAKGAWGRRGCTQVLLKQVRTSTLRNILTSAWRNKAPKTLIDAYSRKRS